MLTSSFHLLSRSLVDMFVCNISVACRQEHRSITHQSDDSISLTQALYTNLTLLPRQILVMDWLFDAVQRYANHSTAGMGLKHQRLWRTTPSYLQPSNFLQPHIASELVFSVVKAESLHFMYPFNTSYWWMQWTGSKVLLQLSIRK